MQNQQVKRGGSQPNGGKHMTNKYFSGEQYNQCCLGAGISYVMRIRMGQEDNSNVQISSASIVNAELSISSISCKPHPVIPTCNTTLNCIVFSFSHANLLSLSQCHQQHHQLHFVTCQSIELVFWPNNIFVVITVYPDCLKRFP